MLAIPNMELQDPGQNHTAEVIEGQYRKGDARGKYRKVAQKTRS